MFHKNPHPSRKPRSCEIYDSQPVFNNPHVVVVDVEDSNGDIVRKHEIRLFPTDVPFTPQTGAETLRGNLARQIKAGMRIEHEPVQLSLARLGNPLDSARIVESAVDSLQSRLQKQLDSAKKDNK